MEEYYGAAAYELCEILCAHAFMITPMSSFDFAKFISTAYKTCLVYEFYSHIDRVEYENQIFSVLCFACIQLLFDISINIFIILIVGKFHYFLNQLNLYLVRVKV